MIIKNITQNTIIAANARRADNFISRLKGLLGTSSLPPGEALIIHPCSSIHTFGMNYPIDIIFLDKQDKVVKIVMGIPSGRVSLCNGANYVVELPSGVAGSSNTTVGDLISIL